jgi:hypothetical protein
MLDTYIKHKGITKTIVHENNKNKINEMSWDADYDGEVAKLSLDVNDDGQKEHFSFKLDNDDLASILNVPSVNQRLDLRLKRDFRDFDMDNIIEPRIIQIKEQPNYLLENPDILTHISSPLPNEELIIPLKINKTSKPYTLTPHKRHKKRKNHQTHKVYRHKKTSSKRTKTTNGRSYKKRTTSSPRL